MHDHNRILLVEDTADLCEMLKWLLECEGYSVHAVFTGEAALQQLTAESYDVLLVDLQLPGIQGDAVINAARQRGMRLWTILMSARPDVDQYAARCGANRCYFKSDPFERLFAHLASATAAK